MAPLEKRQILLVSIPEAAELSLAAQLTGYLISFEWPRMPFIILLPAMAAPIWEEPGFGRFEKHQQRSTASRLKHTRAID